MSITIIIAFIIFFCLRLFTLSISIKNEKRLKQGGAQEYGRTNSLVLAGLHVLFYLGALGEGISKHVQFDRVTLIGLIIYLLATAVLFYVIQQLSPIWTVKLIIAPGHQLNQSPLFRYVRHPNYFLNIIPELIGLALIMKAYWVLTLLFPIYLISLGVRIVQEERLMRATFPEY